MSALSIVISLLVVFVVLILLVVWVLLRVALWANHVDDQCGVDE